MRVKGLVMLLMPVTAFGQGLALLTDFTADSPSFQWYVQDDGVMGGLSRGYVTINEGHMEFKGNLNTKGGGFSSVRSGGFRLDLSSFNGVRLRVKGDGRRYSWQLKSNVVFRNRRLGYWATFDTQHGTQHGTQPGTWSVIDIPFSAFAPRFRGYAIKAPPFDPSYTTEMALFIADGVDGPFTITVESIALY